MCPDFPGLVRHFRFEGDYLSAVPWGGGHINDTFALRFRLPDGRERRYILQRINHEVFRNPEQLMRNVERVTEHLRRKILAAGGDPAREALHLIPVVDGATAIDTLYRAEDGTYWRAYAFVEGAHTSDLPESLTHVRSAGRAFGRFQQLVSDFPASELYETIPDFHHTPKRFQAFQSAVERDVCNRAHAARAEICFVEQRANQMGVLVDLLATGRLPQRVTHNDTKLNNVMVDDETGEGLCVVDLDTVMPGSALYDFGDAVRSAANSAAEDEPDLQRVHFDMAIFESLTQGYLETARDFLTSLELEYLAFSARLITLECGMRFLTDYLNGDIYFKVHRPGHNLDRCRTQFKMVREMEAHFDEMLQIVERFR